MSTRSVIARPDGDGFAGRYAHWDGYPTCRGAQLWQTFTELGENATILRAYAIKEGENGYWSSYQTPSRQAREAQKPEFIDEPCNLCDATGKRTDMIVANGCNGCAGTGVSHRTYGDGVRQGGWTVEENGSWVTSYADDMGTEWAYVLADHALFVFERRFGKPGADQGHGTGMFGMGASDTESGGYWAALGEFPWTGDEPSWDMLEWGIPASDHDLVREYAAANFTGDEALTQAMTLYQEAGPQSFDLEGAR